MEIKYIEVPVRVKPHTDYLDTKGVEELWVKIKEYVAEHGGESGSVNEDEVNALISSYYKEHKDELKGDPFTYADFTAEQLADLKGEQGIQGIKGDKGDKGDPFTYEDFTPEQLESLKGEKGQDGTVSFDNLTEEQRLSLKGEKGDKGDAFTYSDFTPDQLASLKGEKGDKGADGTMVFEDLTDEQRASLKGDKGDTGERGEKGDTGAPFTYDMFTPEQLAALKGEKGDPGEKGEQGLQGQQGIQGVQGIPGTVDYSLVYKKAEIDEKLANLDVNVDDINLENYYDKTEIDNKFSAIEIEGSTGIHVGDTAPENPLVSVWVDTDGIPFNGDADLHETFYTKNDVDNLIETHKYNLSEMVNDIGFITDGDIPSRTSQLTNDSGFLTSENAYTKGSVYTKDEINSTLANYVTTDNVPDRHDHVNKVVLDKLSVIDDDLAFNCVKVALGETNVDLTGYVTETMLSNGLSTKSDKQHTHTMSDITDYTAPEIPSLDGYATESYVTTAIANAQLNNQDVDLSAYALKSEIPDVSGFITSVPEEYVTDTELSAKGYLTEHQDLSSYALKTELPSLTGYATEDYVDTAVATKVEVESNGVGRFGTATGAEIFNAYSDNKATGTYSHAEGFLTQATGAYSHAEGANTIASGKFSHAEGNVTEASSDYQHVEGKFNLRDKSGKYVHIVGNGTTVSSRSNCHTLDWDGNAWFKGKVYVGGTSMSDATELGTGSGGSVDLSNYYTKTEVDGLIPETQDLSGYALKTEIPDVSGFITTIPEEYVTETELNAKGYITEHQDISGKANVEHTHTLSDITDYAAPNLSSYALKTEIPDVSGYATESYVTDAISAISLKGIKSLTVEYALSVQGDYIPNINDWSTDRPDNISYNHGKYLWSKISITYTDDTVVDAYNVSYIAKDMNLSNYYTKSEVNALIPETPDLSGYALKSEIPDLTGYAKTADIPDVSTYQTEAQVNALIDAKLGVIENGTY